MNRKTIVASLSKIANELDKSGLYNEANEVTNIMVKVSQANAPWLAKPSAETSKASMSPNQVVYKVLSEMFGRDYNNKKDLKVLIRDRNKEIRNRIDEVAEENDVTPEKAQQRLTDFMNKTRGDFMANKPPMGMGGGTSVFDPNQKSSDDSIEKDYDLKSTGRIGLYNRAMNWINENGHQGAETAIIKAKADSAATGYPSPVLLKEIIALLQPRVDKYKKQRKDIKGTAADYFGAPIGTRKDPGFDSRP